MILPDLLKFRTISLDQIIRTYGTSESVVWLTLSTRGTANFVTPGFNRLAIGTPPVFLKFQTISLDQINRTYGTSETVAALSRGMNPSLQYGAIRYAD